METAEPIEVATEDRQLTKFGQIEVMASKPNDTQIALLTRLARQAQRSPSADSYGRLFEAFFSIVESLISDEDALRLEAEISKGMLTVEQISTAWGSDGEAPNRRTRRARGK